MTALSPSVQKALDLLNLPTEEWLTSAIMIATKDISACSLLALDGGQRMRLAVEAGAPPALVTSIFLGGFMVQLKLMQQRDEALADVERLEVELQLRTGEPPTVDIKGAP